jgi:hypothetical protein
LRDPQLYRVEPRPDGFCIRHPERSTVTLRVDTATLQLTSERATTDVELCITNRDLCHRIGALLLDEADPAEDPTARMLEAWAIAPAVALERKRVQYLVDADVRAAQIAVRRLCGYVPDLATWQLLADRRYVLRDIANFHTAATALIHLQNGFRLRPGVRRPPAAEPLASAAIADRMDQWRGVYSPDGKPYRSLNRTLAKLPVRFPMHLLPALCLVRLERPIERAAELATLLTLLSGHLDLLPAEAAQSRIRIFMRASASEIRDTSSVVLSTLRRNPSGRFLGDLETVLNYLNDYPEPFTGRLPALARRVERWHRDAHNRIAPRTIETLGGADRETARPPIALPGDPRIRFLDTVGGVVVEGKVMRHCIGHYAGHAVAGDCFLFHVDYQDCQASFEVRKNGHVTQGFGPRNCYNEAVEWGYEKLNRWARALRPSGARTARPDWLPRMNPRRPRRRQRPRVDPRQLGFDFLGPVEHNPPG